MNKPLVVIAAMLALIGLILNVALDRDNVYDMTLSALWALTLILALAGALVAGKKSQASTIASSSSVTQRR
jgi:hypothetical protein